MVLLLPAEIRRNSPRSPVTSQLELVPDEPYVLISHQSNIRIISLYGSAIHKHIIGQFPHAWVCAKVGPIMKLPGTGPLYIIADIDLLNAGILDITCTVYHSTCDSKKVSEVYRKIIRDVKLFGIRTESNSN